MKQPTAFDCERGDKVQCEWNGEWYDGKIVKVDGMKYLVHYSGWNSRHDAWVTIDKLAPAAIDASRVVAPPASPPPSSAAVVEPEDSSSKRKACPLPPPASPAKRVKLSLPRELKEQLVSDWERITLEPRKWVPLPRTRCVREIVHEFVESKPRDSKRWRDFGDAVTLYFDKALPKILLYRHEREQYDLVAKRRHPDSSPSQLYGAEHLVRLFAKLPELLVKTTLSQTELHQTKSKLNELYKWLVKHKDALFLDHYELREKLLLVQEEEEEDDRKKKDAVTCQQPQEHEPDEQQKDTCCATVAED